METVGYCIRVQALDGYADKIGGLYLDSDYTSLISVKHHGKKNDNPHYHIVVRTAVKAQAFRVRMKKIFSDAKGNQHMSLRQWDGDSKAISYLFHEDPESPLVVRKGITDDFLAICKSQNVVISALVVKAKTKASVTLFDDALEHFGKSKPTVSDVKRLSDEDMGTWMILYALRNGKYAPPAWQLRQMVVKVKFHLLRGNEDAEDEYARELARNIFCG